MAHSISIPTFEGDDHFSGYIARPGGTAKAAIIVIQEIFGINAGIRRKCDTLAGQGYVAIAPDLFWRIRPGIELDADVPEQMEEALSLIGQFDQEQAIRDIEGTIRVARGEVGGGKVGAVGYCLGGRLAFMVACRTDIDAAVGYYGVGIDGLIREAHAIGKPVLLHIAQNDHFVSAETQKAMHAGLDDNRHVTLFDYPGLDHGFAAQSGARRDDEGAALADRRTHDFLTEALTG